MRPLGGLLLAVLAIAGAPGAVMAAVDGLSAPSQALMAAPFIVGHPAEASAEDTVAMAVGGVFPVSSATAATALAGQTALFSHSRSSPGGAVDTLRLSVSGPVGLRIAGAEAYDIDYVRGWPGALKISRGGYDLDISPHAGLGLSGAGAGGSAEAGAKVRLGAHLQDRVISQLDGLGVRELDPAAPGDRGRWYLFAAASGRSVGLARTGQAGVQRLGWSADAAASSLTSDAQAGVAWRKGEMQASIGYVHREVRPLMTEAAWTGSGRTLSDSMVAFSLSVHRR